MVEDAEQGGGTMSDTDRLVIALTERGPICERCLAAFARLSAVAVSTAVQRLRGHVAVVAEINRCGACERFTRTLALGTSKTD